MTLEYDEQQTKTFLILIFFPIFQWKLFEISIQFFERKKLIKTLE